jgi:hypothetical protein
LSPTCRESRCVFRGQALCISCISGSGIETGLKSRRIPGSGIETGLKRESPTGVGGYEWNGHRPARVVPSLRWHPAMRKTLLISAEGRGTDWPQRAQRSQRRRPSTTESSGNREIREPREKKSVRSPLSHISRISRFHLFPFRFHAWVENPPYTLSPHLCGLCALCGKNLFKTWFPENGGHGPPYKTARLPLWQSCGGVAPGFHAGCESPAVTPCAARACHHSSPGTRKSLAVARGLLF